MPRTPVDEIAAVVRVLQAQLHALEIVAMRTMAAMEDIQPGVLDEMSEPVLLQDRPDAEFDEHLEDIEEHIARLVIWARQYRGELE
jgi:hypothetical protein